MNVIARAQSARSNLRPEIARRTDRLTPEDQAVVRRRANNRRLA